MKTAQPQTERKYTVKTARFPRVIFNDDTMSLRGIPKPHNEDRIGTAVDYLKGTQVGTLCWCPAAEIAFAYPSKKIDNVYDKLRAHGRRGFCAWGPAKGNLMISLYQKGIDYMPLLISRVHEAGIQFFASIRMNDDHHKSTPRGPLAPEFWQKHQEYRLWEITDARSYYNGCLDYSYAPVRKRKLDVIFEVAQMYDIDGIELDMMRNAYFFQPSEAWKKRGILTDFVKRIRAGLKAIGKKRGRNISLIIRIPFGEQVLRLAGIDVKTWIRNKLMDVLVMGGCQSRNDYNQSVEPYLGLCRKRGIPFYGSVEWAPSCNDAEYPSMAKTARYHFAPQTVDEKLRSQRAMAAHFLEQGVDGIYMFNYASTLFEGKTAFFDDRPAFDKLASLLSEIGDAKTLANADREYFFFSDLPIYAESNRPKEFHQTIRFTLLGRSIRKAKKVAVSFRQIAMRNPHAIGNYKQNPMVPRGYVHYYVNGKKVPPRSIKIRKQPAGKIMSGFDLDKHQLVEISLPPKKIKNGVNTLAFEIPRFPEARDPYIYIYELKVRVIFQPAKQKR